MERKLSIDILPGEEILLSGQAKVSIVRIAGRRVRVMVKAEENVTVVRVVN